MTKMSLAFWIGFMDGAGEADREKVRQELIAKLAPEVLLAEVEVDVTIRDPEIRESDTAASGTGGKA